MRSDAVVSPVHCFHRKRFTLDAWGTQLILALFLFTLVSCGSKSNEPEPVVIKQIWYTPAWSPDGTEIACVVRRYGDSANAGLFISILDAVSGEVRREQSAEDFPLPFAFSWTPDGVWLLFGANPGISRSLRTWTPWFS